MFSAFQLAKMRRRRPSPAHCHNEPIKLKDDPCADWGSGERERGKPMPVCMQDAPSLSIDSYLWKDFFRKR